MKIISLGQIDKKLLLVVAIIIINIINVVVPKEVNPDYMNDLLYTFMEDLELAGGVYAVMKELEKKNLLNEDLMTVTGKTIKENLANVKEVVKSEITNTLASYTMEELQGGMDAVARESILENVQAMFNSNFIYDISFSSVLYS